MSAPNLHVCSVPPNYLKASVLCQCVIWMKAPTEMEWVGKALAQCLLFPPMLKSACQREGTKPATGKSQNPTSSLTTTVLRQKATSSIGAGGAAEPNVALDPPGSGKVLQGNRENQFVLGKEILSFPRPRCGHLAAGDVLALLKVLVLPKGGKAPDTRNAEKGSVASVFLSALW